MSRFKFNMEAVLTVRAREEQGAAVEWAHAVQAQAKAEERLAAANQALEESHRVLAEKRSKTFRPGDHELFLCATNHQKAICNQLAAELSKAIEMTQKTHVALLEARMKHEVLVRLKAKKLHEHECSIRVQEEKELSDLIIGRHSMRRAQA